MPKLGGQNADYLEIALQGYRRGTRGHDTMQAQASTLSDQDIADVAAYFESFEGEAETGRTRASAQKIEAGRAKAATCVACHGARRRRGRAAVAELSRASTRRTCMVALEHYKDGSRVDLVMNPLIGAARRAKPRRARGVLRRAAASANSTEP